MQDKDRRETPYTGDERATLTGFLDFHRDTLEWKCDGLTPAQLAQRGVPPSSMSLLGLVRHLADVERGWFRRGVAGETAEPLFYTDDNLDGDFDDVDGATQADVDRAFAAWRAEAARASEIIAATELDQTFVSRRGDVISLRWVLVHLIEEYARHNGHADLLRELIDGATGE